ncbi:hypothetical protein SEA_XENIA2_53 [Gordonia phage Xenia2]
MPIQNEVALTCDGPRCDHKIVWDGDLAKLDDVHSTRLAEQMRKSAIESSWYIVDHEELIEINDYYAFHNVQCLKRYFREHATSRKPKLADVY